MAAKIASLKIKAEWEKWLVKSTHHPSSGPTPDLLNESDSFSKSGAGSAPPVFNEVLWMATKRVWRARLRLAAQQLPSQGDQG